MAKKSAPKKKPAVVVVMSPMKGGKKAKGKC